MTVSFWAVGARARERKDIGAGAREEPGARTRKMESTPGPERRKVQ